MYNTLYIWKKVIKRSQMSTLSKQEKINWYQWESSALAKAKQENRAIFLFIDSPTSQWSQKMQKDSFEDANIIELLNERFIAIRVNKYERPDIERYYQKIYSLMNREPTASPLSLFLTENLEPFYAGSYIPSEAIDQQLSLDSLLRIISKKYITDYDTLVQKGEEVLSFIDKQEKTVQATKLDINITKTIELHTKNLLDSKFGGFTKAPKFPNTSTLELLLTSYELTKNESTLSAITLTLDNMIKGGFYDKARGGFYQYATDEAWEEAYELKTSYDNAQLIKLYLRAFTITKNETYKKVAFKTIDFMLNQRGESKLFSLKGENIIGSWNALMVQALFLASQIDETYKHHALETLEALLSTLYVSGTLYHSKKPNEKPSIKAFLDDYATLGEALIMAYQNIKEESFLIMATQFSNLIIEQYYEQAQWVYTTGQFKLKESIYDKEIPSALASALSLLFTINSLVDNDYRTFIFKTLELHSYTLMRQPFSSPTLTKVMLSYLKEEE